MFFFTQAGKKAFTILEQFDKILQGFSCFNSILSSFLCTQFSVRKFACQKEWHFISTVLTPCSFLCSCSRSNSCSSSGTPVPALFVFLTLPFLLLNKSQPFLVKRKFWPDLMIPPKENYGSTLCPCILLTSQCHFQTPPLFHESLFRKVCLLLTLPPGFSRPGRSRGCSKKTIVI